MERGEEAKSKKKSKIKSLINDENDEHSTRVTHEPQTNFYILRQFLSILLPMNYVIASVGNVLVVFFY
jgi:hypothetical protein